MGYVPEWAFEDEPIWLTSMRSFLHQPSVLLLDVIPDRSPNLVPDHTFHKINVVSIQKSKLREWSKRAVKDANESQARGESSRPLAVTSSDFQTTEQSIEILKSVGLTNLANCR